jgi:hypothetical protein
LGTSPRSRARPCRGSSRRAGRLLLRALREILFQQLFLAGEGLSREADAALSAEVRPRLSALDELVRGS